MCCWRRLHKIVSAIEYAQGTFKLGDKTILEMVTDKIDEVSDVENIYIVTNESFISSLKSGAKAIKVRKVKVIDDHTTSNDNRLGAIGDLKYVIDTEKYQ